MTSLRTILTMAILTLAVTESTAFYFRRISPSVRNLFGEIGGLGRKFRGLENDVIDIQQSLEEIQPESIRDAIEEIESKIEALESEVVGLQQSIQQIQPGCPQTAVGAEVIGDLCYSLEMDLQSYVDAKSGCFQKGGELAQPLTSDDSFFERILEAFPAAAGIPRIYLQIISDESKYFYESNGITIPNTDPRFDMTASPAVDRAAALLPDGVNWKLTEVNNRDSTPLPYLCQYYTV